LRRDRLREPQNCNLRGGEVLRGSWCNLARVSLKGDGGEVELVRVQGDAGGGLLDLESDVDIACEFVSY